MNGVGKPSAINAMWHAPVGDAFGAVKSCADLDMRFASN
jgi:hypothetical protein